MLQQKEMSNTLQTPFWADTHGWIYVLFKGGQFMNAWPWSKENTGDLAAQLNAMSRLVIYLTAVVAILFGVAGDPMQALIAVMIGLLMLGGIVVYYNNNRPEESPLEQSPEGEDTTKRGFLKGVQNPVNNPYGNPMPYGSGVAVRSSKPPMQYYTDDCLAKLYRGTDEWDENLFFNQIPDPTLIARPVFWPQDPRPDIVSNEAACADRKCR